MFAPTKSLWYCERGDDLMEGKVRFEGGTNNKNKEPLEENVWLENDYDTMVNISNTLTTFVILHSKKCMTKRYVPCTCTNTCLELQT